MKVCLFALGLALCCAVQADDLMPFEDADLSTLTGPWKCRAMATNCPKLREMSRRMPVIPVMVHSVKENKFGMKLNLPTPQGCKEINPVIKKEDGVYTTTCERGGKKIMDNIQIHDSTQASISTKITSDGTNFCVMVTCMSRDLPVKEDFMSNCRSFVRKVSLNEADLQELREEGKHSAGGCGDPAVEERQSRVIEAVKGGLPPPGVRGCRVRERQCPERRPRSCRERRLGVL
ncbi:uncharacterized protein PHA67_001723 [Liasis olivaceus]